MNYTKLIYNQKACEIMSKWTEEGIMKDAMEDKIHSAKKRFIVIFYKKRQIEYL